MVFIVINDSFIVTISQPERLVLRTQGFQNKGGHFNSSVSNGGSESPGQGQLPYGTARAREPRFVPVAADGHRGCSVGPEQAALPGIVLQVSCGEHSVPASAKLVPRSGAAR